MLLGNPTKSKPLHPSARHCFERIFTKIAAQVWMVIQIPLNDVAAQLGIVNQVAESMQSRLLTRGARHCDNAGERFEGFPVDFRITNLGISTVEIVLDAISMVYRKIPQHVADGVERFRAVDHIVRTPWCEQRARETLNRSGAALTKTEVDPAVNNPVEVFRIGRANNEPKTLINLRIAITRQVR